MIGMEKKIKPNGYGYLRINFYMQRKKLITRLKA